MEEDVFERGLLDGDDVGRRNPGYAFFRRVGIGGCLPVECDQLVRLIRFLLEVEYAPGCEERIKTAFQSGRKGWIGDNRVNDASLTLMSREDELVNPDCGICSLPLGNGELEEECFTLLWMGKPADRSIRCFKRMGEEIHASHVLESKVTSRMGNAEEIRGERRMFLSAGRPLHDELSLEGREMSFGCLHKDVSQWGGMRGDVTPLNRGNACVWILPCRALLEEDACCNAQSLQEASSIHACFKIHTFQDDGRVS